MVKKPQNLEITAATVSFSPSRIFISSVFFSQMEKILVKEDAGENAGSGEIVGFTPHPSAGGGDQGQCVYCKEIVTGVGGDLPADL